MSVRGIFKSLILLAQLYWAPAHASPNDLAARLEKVANQRLSADEFRQLAAVFENGLLKQQARGPIIKISETDPPRTYLACLAGNISAGISLAGLGICSDMRGNLYSLDFGFSGLGLGAGANVFGGYVAPNGHNISGRKLEDSDSVFFRGMAGGASYVYGARAICGSSNLGFDLCLFGVEFGIGANVTPDGYLVLSKF